jgi:hypothetical protein
MTNPAPTAAPLPGQSLDLTPGANPQPATAAALEKVEWTGVLKVGRREFNLVPVLPAITMVKLQQAQDSGQFLEIIEAIPLLVLHPERETLKAYLLDDPADSADVVTLDAVVEALSDGLEQIANRPSDK